MIKKRARLTDKETRVEDVIADEEPPFSGGIITERPMHAEDHGEENEKAKFYKKHAKGDVSGTFGTGGRDTSSW
jgi:hypothetical protein